MWYCKSMTITKLKCLGNQTRVPKAFIKELFHKRYFCDLLVHRETQCREHATYSPAHLPLLMGIALQMQAAPETATTTA